MSYGNVKVDYITFSSGSPEQDVVVSVSGLVAAGTEALTVSGNIITTNGDIQAQVGSISAPNSSMYALSGIFTSGLITTATGTNCNYTNVTAQNITGVVKVVGATVSGTTVTGNAAQFTTLAANSADITTTLDVDGVTTSAGLVSTTTVTIPDGTATSPSIKFDGDANTGIYSPGGGTVSITTNGVDNFSVNSVGAIAFDGDYGSTGYVLNSNGSSDAPEWKAVPGLDTSNIMLLDGTNAMTGTMKVISGTVTAPGITFVEDLDTGFYNTSPNVVTVTTSGVARFSVDNGGSIHVVGGGSVSDGAVKLNGNGNVTASGYYRSSQGTATDVAFATFLTGTETTNITADGTINIGGTPSSDPNAKISPDGRFIVASGTANVPAVSFLDDADTGIFTDDTSCLGITTQGTEAVKWNANGAMRVQSTYGTSGQFFICQGANNAPKWVTVTGSPAEGSYLKIDGTNSMAAPLQVTSGTVTAPSITFVEDNNTGLYASAADQLSITTGGTARVTVKSDGKVGIGTTSPTTTLDVDGAGTFSGDVIAGVNPHDGAGVGARLDNAGVVQATRASGSATSAVWMGYTENTATETSRINANGAAIFTGITKIGATDGSSSGGNGVYLDANGSIYSFKSAGTSTGYALYAGGSEVINFKTDGSASFDGTLEVQDGASGVTSSTNNVLTVEASDVTSKTRAISIDGKDTIPSSYQAFRVQYGTSEKISLSYDGSASFDGNVGIGTTSPSQILELKSGEPRLCLNGTTANSSKGIEFEHDGGRMAHIFHNPTSGELDIACGENTGGSHYITFKAGDGTEKMRIDSTGQVTIGDSSAIGAFQVKSTETTKAYFRHGSSNQTTLAVATDDTSASIESTYQSGASGSYKPLAFRTGGAERMSIAADGKVSVAGNLDIGNTDGSSSNTGWWIQPNGQAYVFTASDSDAIKIYSGGTENVTINSSGAATFTEEIFAGSTSNTGRSLMAVNTSTSNPTILAQNNSAGNVWEGWDGTGTATKTSWITGAGAATFAGTVQSSNTAGGFVYTGYQGSDDANVWLGASPTDQSTNYAFLITDSQAGNFVTGISVDGAATFAGNINTGGNPWVADSNGGILYYNGTTAFSSDQNTYGLWRGYTTGTNVVTSEIFANGTATFAGNISTVGDLRVGSLTAFAGTPLEIEVTGSSTGAVGMSLINSLRSNATATCALRAYQDTRQGGEILFGRENASDWNSSASYALGFISFNPAAGTSGAVEKMRITSGGNVGIGTIAPDSTLHIQSPSGSTTMNFTAPLDQPNKIQFRKSTAALDAEIKNESTALIFATGSTPTEAFRISSAQDVYSRYGVSAGGNASAGWILGGSEGDTAYFGVQGKSSGEGGAASNALFIGYYGSSNTIRFNCDGRAVFGTGLPGGASGIGAVMLNDGNGGRVEAQAASGGSQLWMGRNSDGTITSEVWGSGAFSNKKVISGVTSECNWYDNGSQAYVELKSGGTQKVFLSAYDGNCSFASANATISAAGAITGTSKSFTIPHPLPSKTDTHQLIHGSIEGPQADLIYRGAVTLEAGKAIINIDTVSQMTEGTFAVLCKNISVFTSNESDWTAVRGSVVNNILTIEAQDNTSTAQVSWLVVGERKDPTFINGDTTDENGKLIVERLKVVTEL